MAWKVFFESGFWAHRGRDHAGTQIAIGKTFAWGGRVWKIPAVYACGQGLVVDFCVCIPHEQIRAFMERWNLSVENDPPKRFTREQQRRIDAENPLNVEFDAEVMANGRQLSPSRGCSVAWNPCVPKAYALVEVKPLLEQYALDLMEGWVISRRSFEWATCRKPEMQSLRITLEQGRTEICGPHFHVGAPGDQAWFIHPATGEAHTLTVQAYERQELPEGRLEGAPSQVFPTHFTAMRYTVAPDLPNGAFQICDCAPGDAPKPKPGSLFEPKPRGGVACIGIIGGVEVSGSGQEGEARVRTACSALHFEPAEDVAWQVVFYEKQAEDLELELI